MSSFRRKPPPLSAGAPSGAPPGAGAGVKPFVNGQALVSSGLSQLDAFLGGGLLLGSVCLLEAAPAGDSGAVSSAAAGAALALVDDLHRYFVAEGVAAGQRSVLAAEDAAALARRQLPLELSLAQSLAKRQPQQQQEQEGREERDKELTIAWQYGKYAGQAPRTSSARFCHSFDLSRPMQAALLVGDRAPEAVDLRRVLPAAPAGAREAYAAVFAAVAAAVDAVEPRGPLQVVRVCVRELGSPAIAPPTGEHMAALLWFVRKLRALAATGGGGGGDSEPRRRVVCQLSGAALASAFPAALANELRHASDYVLQLRAFAGARDLLPPELGELDGLLELRKLPRVHALAALAGPATRLGVRRDRRKLRVDALHLAPEASRSSDQSARRHARGAGDPLAF